MTSLKFPIESENKTATSHVVDIRYGMEDNLNNPFLAEMYNKSKTCDESFRQMHKISSEERTVNFDKNVTYFQNLKSKDSSVYLTEFETIRTDVLKKNMAGNERNRMSLLQEKIVSSSVETVQIIESSDPRERVSSSKQRDSARDGRGRGKQSKNFSIQKGGKPFIKRVNSSSRSVLASKTEIKALPSRQSNFQLGTNGTLVGDIPSAKGSSVDNNSQSASSKKRKYKVKVKVRRKKQKRKSSPPPPPPPPKLSPHPSKSPPPPPPPPLPRLPRPSQQQAGFSLPTYSSPLITPPIPALAFPPGPSIPNYPHGNSKSRNVATLPTYPPEMLTMIPYYQLHQAVQTPSQCTVGGLPHLQVTGYNIQCAVNNSYPSFFAAPHALPFYSNYPAALNTRMHVCQQRPVLPYTNSQPRYSNWNAGNFRS